MQKCKGYFMLNWDDYRVFLDVARSGSLSAASSTLKINPATVGRRITRLEESLGSKLFNKLPRGYQLTQAGSELQEHIEHIERTEKKARGALQKASATISGSFRIGAPDGLSNYVLPIVIANIQKQHPNLDIQILSLPRVFNLSRREADLAIMVTPPKTGRFLIKKIVNYHLHLAAHSDYLKKSAPILSKADLKNHTIIGYIPDLIFDPTLDYMSEVTPDRIPDLSSNSVAVQMQILNLGAGIGFAHDFALAHFSGITPVLKTIIHQERAFYMVRDRDDRASEQSNLIASLLYQGIKKEVKRLETLAYQI
jgi:DNA-binding transcriptional LysR family regulator|tara:strand:- start:41010 stop:41939 length:930 start_codon:yes stop_codon:yes gene_type:complete